MEMPDKIYLFPDANSIGDLGFTITYPNESWDGRNYIEYHHSRIVEDLKENLSKTGIALAARNSDIIELRLHIAELEAIIEARGM